MIRTWINKNLRAGSGLAWCIWLLLVAIAAPGLVHLRIDNSLDASLPELRSVGPYSTFIVLGWPDSTQLTTALESRISERPEFSLILSPRSAPFLKFAGVTPDNFIRGSDPSYVGAYCFPKPGVTPQSLNAAAHAVAAISPNAVAVGGPAAFTTALDDYSQRRMPLIVGLIAVVSVLLLRWITMRWKTAILSLFACGIAQVVLLGSLGWHDRPLHLTLLIVPPLALCFGFSYAAHRALRPDATLPLLLCMFTAATGITCSAFTPVHSIRSFGIWGAFAVVLTWAAVTTLISAPPTLIDHPQLLPGLYRRIVSVRSRYKKQILIFSGLALLLTIPASQYLRFRSNSISMFPPTSRVRQDFESLNTRLTGMLPFQLRATRGFELAQIDLAHAGVRKVLNISVATGGPLDTYFCLADNDSLSPIRDALPTWKSTARSKHASLEVIGVAGQLIAAQKAMETNALESVPLMLLLGVVTATLISRSLRRTVPLLLALVLPAVGLLLLAAITQMPTDLATLTIAAIAIGLSTDDAVHLSSRTPYSRLWRPCVGSSLIAILTLLLFTLSPFAPIRQFGVFSSLAIATAAIANHLVLGPSAKSDSGGF